MVEGQVGKAKQEIKHMKYALVSVEDNKTDVFNSIRQSEGVVLKNLSDVEYNSLIKMINKSVFQGKVDIKMVLTDCDGCLTDGGMYYSEKGDELKKFNTKDGMAFKQLREHGILTGIITGENVELNRRRAEKLKLDIYESGCTDKATCIKNICVEKNIDLSNVLYVGDDINDIEVLKIVGYGCAPADAIDEVKSVAKYITKANGGEGVIREITDRIVLVTV